jgi:hypothetical protein
MMVIKNSDGGAESQKPGHWLTPLLAKAKDLPGILREIMVGLTIHELHFEIKKERKHLDHLFMLIVFGDLVGLPLLPPYYTMRLLPFIIPSIANWKRSLLREKDLTDLMSAG